MLRKITKPYNFIILGFAIINFILCFVQFGRVNYYRFSGTNFKYDGYYTAILSDVSTTGTIFTVLCCLLIILGVVLLILKYAKRIEKKGLNITFAGLALITGIFGIIAESSGEGYIIGIITGEYIYGRYAEANFTNDSILDIIYILSILMIIYSIPELIDCFTNKNDNIYSGSYRI